MHASVLTRGPCSHIVTVSHDMVKAWCPRLAIGRKDIPRAALNCDWFRSLAWRLMVCGATDFTEDVRGATWVEHEGALVL